MLAYLHKRCATLCYVETGWFFFSKEIPLFYIINTFQQAGLWYIMTCWFPALKQFQILYYKKLSPLNLCLDYERLCHVSKVQELICYATLWKVDFVVVAIKRFQWSLVKVLSRMTKDGILGLQLINW